MLQKAGHNLILRRAALRNRLVLRDKEIAPKIVQGDEDICDWRNQPGQTRTGV